LSNRAIGFDDGDSLRRNPHRRCLCLGLLG
jgi:hypothetical protein